MNKHENTTYLVKFFIKEKDFLNVILSRIPEIKRDKLAIICIICVFWKIAFMVYKNLNNR